MIGRVRKLSNTVLTYLCVLIISCIALFPIYWIFTTAFKMPRDAFKLPPLIIFKPTLKNFQTVFQAGDFLHLAINSLVVAGGSTMLCIALAFPAAYALSRFRLPGGMAFGILLIRMLPPIAVVISIFLMFRKIGLYDTRIGLILVRTTYNAPLAVWMLRGFIDEIPVEIEEAARIDGASYVQTMYKIVLPLASTGIMATAILAFIFSWNDFFFPLILAGKKATTLPVFLYSFKAFREIKWGPLMATATIMTTPIIIFSVIVRKYLIEGLTFGALKE